MLCLSVASRSVSNIDIFFKESSSFRLLPRASVEPSPSAVIDAGPS
jgi:hypothetical protein